MAAFDLPLLRLFRGHHHPAGACERTDRSQVTTLRDVLSHAPHLKLKIRIVFRQKPVIDDMTAFIFKAVVIRVVLIIGKSHQPVKFTMIISSQTIFLETLLNKVKISSIVQTMLLQQFYQTAINSLASVCSCT